MLTKAQMIEEILMAVKVNAMGFMGDKHRPAYRAPDVGDTFFALAFRTDAELRHICAELHINTRAA